MANDKNDKKVSKKEKKHFFKDFKGELKRVTWPTGKQLVNNTIAVVVIVLITALIVFVLDLCFEGINKYGINKLKSAINSNKTTVVEDNTPAPEEDTSDTEDTETEGQDESTNEETTSDSEAE